MDDFSHDFAEKLINGHFSNVIDIVKYLSAHGIYPKINSGKNINFKPCVTDYIKHTKQNSK